tara:strand:- start:524 stop:835 length:312 start_codon:yes stop_codon:yes gene_type:complete
VNLHHNISGQLTKQLLAAGGGVIVKSISLSNVHASIACSVDIYIEKAQLGKFYMVKTVELPIATTLILEGSDISFSNKKFGLFIKLTKLGSNSGEPAVDVIIS